MSPEEIELLLRQATSESARRMREWVEEIALAKEQNPGKEPFDRALLGKFFDLVGDSGSGSIPDPERDLRIEYRYWVQYPNVRTLEEFGDILLEIAGSGET